MENQMNPAQNLTPKNFSVLSSAPNKMHAVFQHYMINFRYNKIFKYRQSQYPEPAISVSF